MFGKRAKVVKALFASALLTLLIALGVQWVNDERLANELEQTYRSLHDLGLDVKPLSREDNAYPEYEAAMNVVGSGLDATLTRVEDASKKRVVVFAQTGSVSQEEKEAERCFLALNEWLQKASKDFLAAKDWERLNRLVDVDERFLKQFELGQDPRKVKRYGHYPIASALVTRPEAWSFLRSKLERDTLKDDVIFRLTRTGQKATKMIESDGPVNLPSLRWGYGWRDLFNRRRSFRLEAELAMLRQFRRIAARALEQPSLRAIQMNFDKELANALAAERTPTSVWASERISVGTWTSPPVPYRQMALIEIDLRESRQAGKSPVPTWSKPYCVDPNNGSPMKVSTDAKEMHFVSSTFASSRRWIR